MERALASVKEREGDVQVQLEYKPFLVDPALPMEKAISRVSTGRYRVTSLSWLMPSFSSNNI